MTKPQLRFIINRRLLALLVLVLVLCPRDAWAYIDPGTGSVIYQTLLVILLGAGFLFRKTWSKLLSITRARMNGGQAANPIDTRDPR